jgi:hypothetical protein
VKFLDIQVEWSMFVNCVKMFRSLSQGSLLPKYESLKT